MSKEFKIKTLLSYKKVLPILLFVMLIIPKNVFAFTVTYDSYGGYYDDNSTTNVVEYDSDKTVIDGEYKEPTILHSCGDRKFIGWFYDKNMKKQFYLRDETEDVTVYAGYSKYTMCFPYTGAIDVFTALKNSTYTFELWGASGGTATWNGYGKGYLTGYGAYTSGKLDMSKDQSLFVQVGGKGGVTNSAGSQPGGYNGGGNGWTLTSYLGSGGGGATDIRLVGGEWNDDTSLNSRIMVAAGGGGGSYSSHTETVRLNISGGALESMVSTRVAAQYRPTPATQTSGGVPKNLTNKGTAGTFGIGGNGARNATGGGGGGYYGGAGEAQQQGVNPNPTGGSSFISGYTGAVAIASEDDRTPRLDSNGDQCTNESALEDNECSIHYSNIVFSEPVMIAGNSTMPNKTGTGTMIGNRNSDGYAKVSTDEENFHIITFKHEGEPDFIAYVIDGEKVNEPNIYLTRKTGYDIKSWEIDGSTDEWDFDDPVTEDMILKTYYSPIIYNITYNLDSGIVSGNPDTYTIESNDITLNNPTKEHYTFKGWSGTDLTGDENLTVTIETGSIGDREYTANWTPSEYTITYDLDGGELETGVTNPDTYTIESNNITLNNPVREGYTFLGWTGSNGTTPTNVLIPTGSTGNKTYKANYKIDRHTAIFDSNLGEDAVPETITKDYNEELGTLPTTSRRGYIFEGWFTGKTDGTKISSTTKMPSYNPTYYAHWTPITYTMRFNSNGGEGTMSDEVISYGTSKALTDNAFTKEGYTFAGWNSKADGTGTNYINKQEVFNLTDVDGTVFNLYAVWTKDEYIISYNLDGGQVSNPVTTYSIDTEDFNLVNPTKEGYTFTGWTGSNGTVEEETVTIVKGTTGNKEYTAHYKAVDYNITYLSNNDDATVTGIGNPVTYTVEDSNITLNNPSDPDTYHYFVGWTTNLDTEEDLSMNYTINTSLIKDIKVYAVYQTSPYTVYFDSDGGNEIDSISREGTEDVGILPIPKKEGYKFKGWFVNNILIDETFHSRVDVTAVAKWEKIEIPVDVTPVDNPTTGDNILKHVMLLVISLIGLGISTVKFKLKLKTKKVL